MIKRTLHTLLPLCALGVFRTLAFAQIQGGTPTYPPVIVPFLIPPTQTEITEAYKNRTAAISEYNQAKAALVALPPLPASQGTLGSAMAVAAAKALRTTVEIKVGVAQALLERANKLAYAIDLVSPGYALIETAANLVNHTPNRPPSPLADSEAKAIADAVLKIENFLASDSGVEFFRGTITIEIERGRRRRDTTIPICYGCTALQEIQQSDLSGLNNATNYVRSVNGSAQWMVTHHPNSDRGHVLQILEARWLFTLSTLLDDQNKTGKII